MTGKFVREERYIVFKVSDLGNSLKGDEIRRLAREYAEHRQRLRKKPLECVVVEKDWPEYEPTWKAIEARVNGVQPAPSVPDLNLSDPAVQKRLAAQWGYVPAEAQPAPSVPEGWNLVPIEPTKEMRAAWDSSPICEDDDAEFRRAYSEMLAAAPEAKP